MNLAAIKEQLCAEYPSRIELHAHTKPASPCGDLAPETVVETFAAAGYHGIAITNHFFTGIFERYYQAADKKSALEQYLSDYHRALEAGEKIGIKVYLGAELRWEHLSDNDYLLLGVDEAMLSDVFDYMKGDAATFVRDCKSEKSFFLQAHPFRDGLTRLSPALLDGMEAFNLHPGHNSRIALASQFADAHHLIKTIGTDFHHEGHHNLCATRMKILPDDSFALAAELKKNDFIADISGSLLLP